MRTISRAVLLSAALVFPAFAAYAAESVTVYKSAT